jgi:hypothetical protein
MTMKKLAFLAISILAAATAFAQSGRRSIAPNDSFASDRQTLPVVANTTGLGGAVFRSYVAILNPTSSAFSVTASFYDSTGTKKDATIALAAGELRVYGNFLATVFNTTGGGAVVLSSPDPSNRFIVSSQVQTGNFSTDVPALEFAGSNSRSFAPGISVNSQTRTNVGCFNQSDAANSIKATVLDSTGKLTIGSVTLNLPAKAWGQTGIPSVVSDGYVQFDPSDSAVCYAVVVDNTTNDGHFISAAEYRP